MNYNIDIDSLRKDLIEYYGTATPIYQMAFVDICKVQTATSQELILMAQSEGFNLMDYAYED